MPTILLPAGQINVKGPQSATGIDRWTQEGSIALTGLALVCLISIAVPVGALGFTGQALITGPQPGVGALGWHGLTPTADATTGTTIIIPAGAVAYQGLTPSPRTGDLVVVMSAGQLVIKGPARPASLFQPPAGVLAWTGRALNLAVDSPGSNITIPVGTLGWHGLQPDRIPDHPIVLPAGTLALTGQYVAVAFKQPDVGRLVFTGLAPSIGGSTATTIVVQRGALFYSGLAYTQNLVCALPVGTLNLTGLALTPIPTGTISIPAGALGWTGRAATIDWVCAVPKGTLNLSSSALYPDTGRAIPVGALTLTGYALSIAGEHAPSPPAGRHRYTGYAVMVLRTEPEIGRIDGLGSFHKRIRGRGSNATLILGRGSL